MENNSTLVNRKAFIVSAVILIALIIASGIISTIVPSGEYQREIIDGVEVIIPDTFEYIEAPDYPVWRWFTAPFEVFLSDDITTVAVLVVVLFLISGSVRSLANSGVLPDLIARIISKFGTKRNLLIIILCVVDMLIGATLGLFEEALMLLPIMVILCNQLGWDDEIALGLSVLAVGFGFSAALTNPWSIGVAQEIVGLKAFSGIWYRAIFFVVMAIVFTSCMIYKVKKRERLNAIEGIEPIPVEISADPKLKKGVVFFVISMLLMVVGLVLSMTISFLSGLALPIMSLFFLLGGVGGALKSGYGFKAVLKDFKGGAGDMLAALVLILLALSTKVIITNSKIVDTLVYVISNAISSLHPVVSAIFIYLFVLVLDFFISSASAKAFLVMSILSPLCDVVGVTQQTAVLAFQFGDGFSNILFPTSAVLLIALSMVGISYSKWFKWVIWLQLAAFILSIAFVGIAVVIGYN